MTLLKKPLVFWLLTITVTVIFLYSVRSILTPFVVGIVLAYFLDPLADRLELKMGRGWAVTLIALVFTFVITLLLLLIVPALAHQLVALISNLPEVLRSVESLVYGSIGWIEAKIPLINFPVDMLPKRDEGFSGFLETQEGASFLNDIQKFVTNYFRDIASGLGKIAASVWNGSLAVLGAFSFIIVTPVVTLYFLYDWNNMLAKIDTWLPRIRADLIRQLAGDIDRTLAAFIRGQLLVCLFLAVFYAVALLLVGLKYWLIVGLVVGALTFIPYIGAAIGLVLTMGLAVFQFDNLFSIGVVLVIFIVGQMLEGKIVTPKLVGNRVGLHPLWIIFSLMAGGVLFGFMGILVAIPVTAVLGVFVRFSFGCYLESGYFCPENLPENAGMKKIRKLDEDPAQDESTNLA